MQIDPFAEPEELPEENSDGSVTIEDPEGEVIQTAFMDNLVTVFPFDIIRDLATDLCDLVEKDKDSRKKRDEQYEEGLRRSGLGNDAPGGAEFSGSSKVVHPVLAEACVDFSSRAIKELFPPTGPVKQFTVGNASEADLERA